MKSIEIRGELKPAFLPKIRVLKEGDPCRNCKTPVLKKIPRKKKIKPHQTYYFEYTLICPNCRNVYTVEAARREDCGLFGGGKEEIQ